MPLYALGSNSSYQLSLQHTRDVDVPSLTTLNLPLNEHPVKIAAGANHTLLLTNKGTLYVTGNNVFGQCLLPPCTAIPGFTKVDGIWKDCAATWEGSVAVDENNGLRCCGRIKGMNEFKGLMFENGLIERVFGGVGHFIALGEEAYGFGNGAKGQFGTTEGNRLPVENIAQVACGKDFTCLLSNTGEITVLTTSTKHNLLSIPPMNNVKSIAASWSTIEALTSSGTIISWGRSDRGQYPPANLPPITSLAAGSEHFLALSTSHKVYAWGWNEHGNCARPDRTDVTTLHTLPLPADEIPIYIAGGCGTSWIWTTKL
jgi:protein ATS1